MSINDFNELKNTLDKGFKLCQYLKPMKGNSSTQGIDNNPAQTHSDNNQGYSQELKLARIRLRFVKSGGYLFKPDKCECCNIPTQKILAHHHNYNKPLEVIWLCKSCHLKVHYANKEIKNEIIKIPNWYIFRNHPHSYRNYRV